MTTSEDLTLAGRLESAHIPPAICGGCCVMNHRRKIAMVVLATASPLTLVGLQRLDAVDRIATAGAAADSAGPSGSADMPPEPNAPPSPKRIEDVSGDLADVQ